MNDTTTAKPRRVRPARPKPLPLYLRTEWRTDLPTPAPAEAGMLLAQAQAGRIRALATCKGARRAAAFRPVETVFASDTFRARIEAIQARNDASAIAAE
ncbi:hypothetical protein J3R80_10045 [Aliiroseovarius sp. Z3]|uniref:hypothetical protein n=1 Tax=Aliiroseovarius sp. Z3 TaxID=2811402 RepID=UPI0023B20EC9|nr:hypothetical protein [Aliiroseovarius sp. Z3]MDE9450805.1 hypothetical protein [Aliiroseovarius sp. Z3]